MKSFFGIEIGFSAAHFYRRLEWSEQKNRETFGKCFDPHGHGHDYRLHVQFESTTTDQARAREAMELLREEIDHHHLNHRFPEFRDRVPTTENLVLFCCDRLQRRLGKEAEMSLTLWERPDLGAFLEWKGQ